MATKARSLKEFSSATSQILSARPCELQQTAQKILNADHHKYLTVVLASDWDSKNCSVHDGGRNVRQNHWIAGVHSTSKQCLFLPSIDFFISSSAISMN